MKPLYTSVLAILVTVTIVGMLTISTQQVFAPRMCGGCVGQFKQLTSEFEKAVLNAVADDDSSEMQRLVDEYSSNVKTLFETPSPSP
jgi:hypothetical protein